MFCLFRNVSGCQKSSYQLLAQCKTSRPKCSQACLLYFVPATLSSGFLPTNIPWAIHFSKISMHATDRSIFLRCLWKEAKRFLLVLDNILSSHSRRCQICTMLIISCCKNAKWSFHSAATLWTNIHIGLSLHKIEKRAFRNVNTCLNTSISSYLETSGGESSNLYLNVAHFFNTIVN